MPIDYRTGGHVSPQDVHIFVQALIPTVAQGVEIGDVWSDTTASLLKRCTSISPVTFVSTEGGAAAHDILSATHGDTLAAAVSRGSVLVGNATPAWAELVAGAAGTYVRSDGTDVAFSALQADELAYDDATSDPLPADETAAADGVEDSAARKDHRHLGHGQSHNHNASIDGQTLKPYDFGLQSPTELTIASGEVTRVQTFHQIDTEADAASDNLAGIVGGAAGLICVIKPENDGRTVVVTNEDAEATAANRFRLNSSLDYTMDNDRDTLIVIYDAGVSRWIELSRGNGDHSNLSGVTSDQHHAQSHDYDTHTGGVPVADIEYDDATSDPLIDGSAADGTEGSPARKDHVHPLHHAAVTVSGTPDYITLSGQDLVRALIVLTTDVSGILPVANGGTGLSAQPDIEAVISASALKGTATAGAGDADQLPESAETATNKVNYDYIAFDTTTEQNAFFQYSIPKGWDEGTITFRFKWTNAAGLTTETVVMGLKALALSNDEAIDTAWGTEVTVTDTWLAQNDVHISAESAAVTIGGTPAEGDFILFNLARKVASDNLTGDARILEVIITFTRASYTD